MEIVRLAFRPVRRAAHLFFRCQLRLRLRGGVRMEFVERDGAPAASAEELARERERAVLALMLGELGEALDEMPDLRESLRHLVFVEQALAQHGLAALHLLPLDVLQRGLDQFEGLVSNWSPRGLATLRSKMAVALAERGQRGGDSQPLEALPGLPAARARADDPLSVR